MGSVGRRHLGVWIASLVLATALAGCLGGKDPATLPAAGSTAPRLDVTSLGVASALARLQGLEEDPMRFEADITYNIVFVGFDPELIDEERIVRQLPTQYSPSMAWGRSYGDGMNSPLLYRNTYAFHHAPAAFGEDLFAYAQTEAREVPSAAYCSAPGGAACQDPSLADHPNHNFLQRYDNDYGLDRLGPGGTVTLLNAEAAEAWIHENRARFGLEFPKPEYTLFYFDTWTSGLMPPDQYYYYEFTSAIFAGRSTQTLRAWGGTYDFLFMDFGAAPNDISTDNSNYNTVPLTGGLSTGAPAREGTAYNDPPMWHYEGAEATVGREAGREVTRNLNDRVAYDSNVAVNIRLVASYAFRPVYKPVYFINMHLWHDGRALHDKNLAEHVDQETWLRALQMEIPWATVTGSVTTYVLPGDDPGMDAALNEAKAHGAGAYIPIEPVVRHVDANRERYVNTSADVFNVRALLFILEGAYTFYLPAVVGGVAFGDPDGQAWGTISSVNDQQNVPTPRPTKDRFTRINTHEVGHFFGLHHAHDGRCVNPEGRYFSCLDHTWSQTNTVMSYRFTPFTADALDRDTLARGHTTEAVGLALKELTSAYLALDAAGLAAVPKQLLPAVRAAEESVNTALRLYEGGLFLDAVYAAVAGLEHAKKAAALTRGAHLVEEKVLEWETTGVHHAGVSHAVLGDRIRVNAPPGLVKDYRDVDLGPEAESVRIRVSWSNSPASWGDFFVGWDVQGSNRRATLSQALPAPVDGVFYLGTFGVWDVAREGPTDGAIVREHVLDLAKFPALRERGGIVAGAGVQGDAVNGAYKVEVFVTKRVYGDPPTPAAEGSSGAAGTAPHGDLDALPGVAPGGLRPAPPRPKV